MAKPNRNTEVAADEVVENATPATEATAGAAGTDAPAATEGKKAGGSAILMADGKRRIDYIREEFAKGRTRGDIAKELGVAYQIVFAATKAKAEAAPAEGEAAPAVAEGEVTTNAPADAPAAE